VSALIRTTGIVLAGGRSKRFGSDKLIAVYGGAPLIHRPIAALDALGADVVVVQAPDAPDLPMPEGVTVRLVRDSDDDEGPLAGTIAGLAVARTPTALIAAGDMPSLQIPVLRAMIRSLQEPGVLAVWLADGERPRPFPLAVRAREALAAARALFGSDERRMRALPTALGALTLPEPVWTALDPDRLTLRDVDEPGDLGSCSVTPDDTD
jgi:molybdopterin-guanine dinucleotide biosynthesis protein A